MLITIARRPDRIIHRWSRAHQFRCSSSGDANEQSLVQSDPLLVDSRCAPSDFSPKDAVVYPNFISPEEGEVISLDVLSRLKRRRYEKGHWDAVITNYKEVELADAMFENQQIPDIFARIRQHLGQNHLDYDPINWLPCHAIDLKKEGELNAHVDSVKFSGDLVGGLSLLSPCIMRLVPDDAPDEGSVDLYLPPLSLYALTGVARYRYSHQLLPSDSLFVTQDGEELVVERDHRLSVIFRDGKRD